MIVFSEGITHFFNFLAQKATFLHDIVFAIVEDEFPDELILDQTPSKFVPTDNVTMAEKSVIDKHAPLKTKRIRNKRSPAWITNDLLLEIYKRDFLKKKATSTNDPLI